MKVAVNCWILRNKQLDGIGNFTIETLRPLIQSHPEIDFLILCDKKFTEDYFDFPNVEKVKVFPALRHPLLYLFYFEVVLPQLLKRRKADMLLSMEGFVSLNSSCPQIPVIHDLNFEHNPQDVKFKNRIYFRSFFKLFAKKASRIITVSEYSKNDIVTLYKIAPSKIDTVYCGIKEVFNPLNKAEIDSAKIKYADGRDYFLFVGSMHPRKNINRLIEAFNVFKINTDSDFKLLLAGNILWDDDSIKEVLHASAYKKDIIFTGRISDEELKAVMGSAWCLTFVPTFEGFGIPIVEAFQAGIPVICSNITSMPEVGGDACILVDPYDINSIAAAMQNILDPELRKELINKGFVRKQLFSWEKTAVLIYQSLMKCIKN